MNASLRSFALSTLVISVGCQQGGVFSENTAGKYKTKLESGLAAFDAGHFPEAQGDLTLALEAAEKLGDDAKAAVALQNLASLSLRQGKNAEAKTHAAKAAELLAKGPSDDAFLTAAVQLQLGKASVFQADFATAQQSLDKALAGFEKAANASGEVFDVYLTKGMLFQAMGKHAEAQAAYKKAVEVERGRRKIGDETHELAAAYCEMGRDAVDSGDLEAANQAFDRANKILRSLRMMNKDEASTSKPIESWVAANVAWLLHQRSQPIKLSSVYAEAIKNFEKLGRPGRESAFLHREYGRVLLEDQKLPQSEVELKRSLELCHSFYSPAHPELARTLDVYAALLDATSRKDEATECRNKSKAIMASIQQQPKPAETTKQQASAK
jgi:tetratricopeptide (TPR) repeat protein